MDEFAPPADPQRFERSNALWNNLMLNDPWSVGYVTTLIEARSFACKEDWEAFYYESGNARNERLERLPASQARQLDDFSLIRTHPGVVRQLAWPMRHLNHQFGRTPDQLADRGRLLHQKAFAAGMNLTETECIEAVRYRVICQTWNGVVIRERRAVEALQKCFPEVRFEKTSGPFDYEYAVDYEIFIHERRLVGVQIKPGSYVRSQATYVQAARAANRRKNEAYRLRFGVPVLDVIVERGSILNDEVLRRIRALLTGV